MTPKKVLIVDDDDNVRRVLEITLQATTDWEILEAASGREGLTLADTQHPDVILLDVMMPDLDGVETFRQLQAKITTQAIPVIFLTAKALANEQQKLKNLGIQGLIAKPFEAASLGKQICGLLHWS